MALWIVCTRSKIALAQIKKDSDIVDKFYTGTWGNVGKQNTVNRVRVWDCSDLICGRWGRVIWSSNFYYGFKKIVCILNGFGHCWSIRMIEELSRCILWRGKAPYSLIKKEQNFPRVSPKFPMYMYIMSVDLRSDSTQWQDLWDTVTAATGLLPFVEVVVVTQGTPDGTQATIKVLWST